VLGPILVQSELAGHGDVTHHQVTSGVAVMTADGFTMLSGSCIGAAVFVVDFFKIGQWSLPFLTSDGGSLGLAWTEKGPWSVHSMITGFFMFLLSIATLIAFSNLFPDKETAERNALVWKNPLDPLRGKSWRWLGNYRFVAALLFLTMLGLYWTFSGGENLTMNTYTDPKLLDVTGAMDALPALPLDAKDRQDSDAVAAAYRATGTENATAERIDARTLRPNVTPILSSNSTASPLVPNLVPTTGNTSILGSILDKVTAETGMEEAAGVIAASACPVKQNSPLTTAVNGLLKERETGIEPATTSLGS
jgi:hypothetical protein